MKTISKTNILVSILMIFSGIFYSCSNSEGSKANAEEQNSKEMTTKDNKNDAQLMVDLVSAQYYEIRLSKYAVKNTNNRDVYDDAEMMIKDHTAFLNNLKSLAAQKAIAIPNEDSSEVNKKIDSWKDKKADDFNKGWTSEMISGHKDAIAKMQKALDDKDTDADIKNLINSTLPTVRKHLDMLNETDSKLKGKRS